MSKHRLLIGDSVVHASHEADSGDNCNDETFIVTYRGRDITDDLTAAWRQRLYELCMAEKFDE
jgi:hypothetical protein